MAKSRLKNREQYEALETKDIVKKNRPALQTLRTGTKGGKAKPYEEWTKKELYNKTKMIGIDGRSKMNKGELIDALRNN